MPDTNNPQPLLPTPLVSVTELAAAIDNPRLRILDASWHMPSANRDAKAEFAAAHLPRAAFFDIDAVSDHSTDLPHMLPPNAEFAKAMQRLGISNQHHVVVYDSLGLFSAARVWWMLRVYGHANVSVLDGGLPAWQRANQSVEQGGVTPTTAHVAFAINTRPGLVRSAQEVLANTEYPEFQLLDARSKPRFDGTEKEPRAGLRSGHIPGAINIPYRSCLNDDGTMKTDTALQELFAYAGWHPDKKTVASCGSGVTACVLALALAKVGYPATAVYDGSWAEWGALNPDVYPVETA